MYASGLGVLDLHWLFTKKIHDLNNFNLMNFLVFSKEKDTFWNWSEPATRSWLSPGLQSLLNRADHKSCTTVCSKSTGSTAFRKQQKDGKTDSLWTGCWGTARGAQSSSSFASGVELALRLCFPKWTPHTGKESLSFLGCQYTPSLLLQPPESKPVLKQVFSWNLSKICSRYTV